LHVCIAREKSNDFSGLNSLRNFQFLHGPLLPGANGTPDRAHTPFRPTAL
jgi:hypothetical protein